MVINKKSHFPQWLHKPILPRGKKGRVENRLRQASLFTICEEAKCPNRHECFASGTATLLIMGDTCTRNCLFCGVTHGQPKPLDPQESERICNLIKKLELSYVVLTSVTRDDLKLGGADHIAAIVQRLKKTITNIHVEVLVPDFKGNEQALQLVLKSQPDVFNHNIETVPRLFSQIRPEGDYSRSLKLLSRASQFTRRIPTKSGFMVGLGETEDDVVALLHDLRHADVAILTIGQYLRPSKKQVEVKEFISPEQFRHYKSIAEKLGFKYVFSDPFVRSSYKADQVIHSMNRGEIKSEFIHDPFSPNKSIV